jgi:cell division protease FtsH
VQRIINECHDEAKRLLATHRKALDALVRALLERETLNEDEVLEATGLPRAPELDARPLQPATRKTT